MLWEGFWHRRVYFFLSSAPRRSHRQPCKEDGEEEWWPIHPGCPSSVSGEEAAKSSGFKRPSEGNGVTLVAALLPLRGEAACAGLGMTDRSAGKLLLCAQCECQRGQTQPSLCCIQQGELPKLNSVATGQWQQFSGLSCGWSPDIKCGANSLAFILLKKVSVPL